MYERLVIPEQNEVEQEVSAINRWWTFSARFNVAPSQRVPIVRMHGGESEAVMMRWGFVPSPVKEAFTKLGAAHISERTLESSKDFGSAWLNSQRCIIPVAGFYVWRRSTKGYRQPYFVRLPDRPVFGLAAVWARAVTLDDDVIESCAFITVPANSLMEKVDNVGRRMPAVLSRDEYDSWLSATPAHARTLVKAYPATGMAAHAVSPRVNVLKNDDAQLIRPV